MCPPVYSHEVIIPAPHYDEYIIHYQIENVNKIKACAIATRSRGILLFSQWDHHFWYGISSIIIHYFNLFVNIFLFGTLSKIRTHILRFVASCPIHWTIRVFLAAAVALESTSGDFQSPTLPYKLQGHFSGIWGIEPPSHISSWDLYYRFFSGDNHRDYFHPIWCLQ